MTAPQPPSLHVRTVRIDEDVDLLAHIPADVSAAWIHHRQGFVARGCAVRITASGPDRFADASARVREIAASARIDDEVRTRGSGLVALGSFSYASDSPRPSELVVPAAMLGVQGGEAFLTLARLGAAPAEPGPGTWRDLFGSTPRPELGEDDRDGDGDTSDDGSSLLVEPDHTPDEYQGLVAACVGRIARGEAEKIVLSETATVRTRERIEPAVLLERLARRFPSTWVYLADDVIGASPEMLAQTEDSRVFSRVLAGTRPVVGESGLAEDERRAFRADAKERAEHAYAVDSVTSRLAEAAEDVTASAEPFVLRLPGLEHLASEVRGRLRPGTTSLDVAGLLHPSAAVSGTPRDRADAIIAELEPHDRGGYAAPVGWIDADGDGQWAIALRMAHLRGEHEVRVQAGGGLVAASDPVIEHAEALAKMRPVLTALRG